MKISDNSSGEGQLDKARLPAQATLDCLRKLIAFDTTSR